MLLTAHRLCAGQNSWEPWRLTRLFTSVCITFQEDRGRRLPSSGVQKGKDTVLCTRERLETGSSGCDRTAVVWWLSPSWSCPLCAPTRLDTASLQVRCVGTDASCPAECLSSKCDRPSGETGYFLGRRQPQFTHRQCCFGMKSRLFL